MSHSDVNEPIYKSKPKKLKQTLHIEQGLKQLLTEARLHRPPPQEEPTSLEIREIHTLPSVFQPRTIDDDPIASERHITILRNAINTNPLHLLDPLTVWWSGKNWYVIDGHHRYEAYSQNSKAKNSAITDVPISRFIGSIEEAQDFSLQSNSKDKLRMSSRDKLNNAWRLVCLGNHSKSEIQSKTGASTSTIANMRKKLLDIQRDFPDKRTRIDNYAALSITWGAAKQYGNTHNEFGDKEAREQMIRLARELGKLFGNQLSSNPQITAGALEIYSPNLCNRIKQLWAEEIAVHRDEIADELKET